MGIRFLMALWVILFHYGYDFDVGGVIPYPDAVWRVLRDGHWVIGLFFVLSGFILVYNYNDWFQKDLRYFGKFLRARSARIAPVYLASLLIITPIVISYLDTKPEYLRALGEPDLSRDNLVLSWLANVFMLQTYFPSSEFYIWNSPLWSVSADISFYFIFPLFVLFLLSRVRSIQGLVALASGLYLAQILLVVALVSVMDVSQSGRFVYFVYFNPVFRVWEFLLGCVLGLLYLQNRQRATSQVGRLLRSERGRNAIIIVVALVALSYTFIPLGSGRIGEIMAWARWSIAYTPLAVLLIAGIAFGRTFLSWLLENRFIVFMGEASYSLYCLHWIPFFFLLKQAQTGDGPAVWVSVLVLIATLLAAIPVWYLFERPARRWVRGWRRGRARTLARPPRPAA
jgi:peptidoglycan/LPS O-acetylase OafA/YrhL